MPVKSKSSASSNKDNKTKVIRRKDHNIDEAIGSAKMGMEANISKPVTTKPLKYSNYPSVRDSDISNAPSKLNQKQEQNSAILNSKTGRKSKDKPLHISSKLKVGEGRQQLIDTKLSRGKGVSVSSKSDDDSKLTISSKSVESNNSRKKNKEGINKSKKKELSKYPLSQGSINSLNLKEHSQSTNRQNSAEKSGKSSKISNKKEATSNVKSRNHEKKDKRIDVAIIEVPVINKDVKFSLEKTGKSSKMSNKKETTSNEEKINQEKDVKRIDAAIIELPVANSDVKFSPVDMMASVEIVPQSSLQLQESSVTEPSENESRTVDPAHYSLETLESGVYLTTPHDLSDAEVEESFSSRLVEVDELEINDDLPSLSPLAPTVPFAGATKEDEIDSYDEKYLTEDFEDYESDFENDDDDDDEEEDSAQSEDVGDEDFSYLNNKNNKELKSEEVVTAIEAENKSSKDLDKRLLANSSEELVDDNANRFTKSILKTSRPKTGKAFVNFTNVKERARVEKASEILRNRGQLLQEMIQLDTISIELFTQLPESYEAYITVFGNANCIQVSVQTNEDSLSESVQTSYPLSVNKWTQQPVNVSSDIGDYSGVGGDFSSSDADPYETYVAIASDTGRLTKFLDASSQVILQLLEESSVLDEEIDLNSRDSISFGFSKSCISLGAGILSFLERRECMFVSFCPSDSSIILTGHGFQKNCIEDPNLSTTENESIHLDYENGDVTKATNVDCSALICLWSVHQTSFPKMILICRSPPLVSCFSPKRPMIVMAGLLDGSLAAWDLRESNSNHPLILDTGKIEWRLRPPSFITACSQENAAEGSQIIALQTLLVDDENYHDGSFQVVSLSSCGQLTWWVLVQENHLSFWGNDPTVAAHLGAAPWSKIALSRATSLSLTESIARENILGGFTYCYDMKLAQNDPNLLYVATANGNVLHCSRHSVKVFPGIFTPSIGPGPEASCISVCPHDHHYFLVGGFDGLIRLHSVTLPNPLTCWQASTNPAPIKNIKWSQSRPCVFYMLDYLGMFHIWDLSAGDIYPTISVDDGMLIGGKLMSFDLSSVPSDDFNHIYAVFASDSGTVGIRSIDPHYLHQNEEEYNNELHRFKCYVNII